MLLFSVLSLLSAICVIELKCFFYFQTEHSTVIMINARDKERESCRSRKTVKVRCLVYLRLNDISIVLQAASEFVK